MSEVLDRRHAAGPVNVVAPTREPEPRKTDQHPLLIDEAQPATPAELAQPRRHRVEVPDPLGRLEPRPRTDEVAVDGREEDGAILLIDEIDKADQEFEAFLLELLSDYQVSIPEIGTVKAVTKPIVILTSNNTRELGDALKRRCLHLYIPFPDPKLEQEIISVQVP